MWPAKLVRCRGVLARGAPHGRRLLREVWGLPGWRAGTSKDAPKGHPEGWGPCRRVHLWGTAGAGSEGKEAGIQYWLFPPGLFQGLL